MNKPTIEFLPQYKHLMKPLFASQEEYEKFRDDFYEKIKPDLDKYRRAHRLSEEAARRHMAD